MTDYKKPKAHPSKKWGKRFVATGPDEIVVHPAWEAPKKVESPKKKPVFVK